MALSRFTMSEDCFSEDHIDSYVLGRLAKAQADALETHVKTCQNCRESVLAAEAFRDALRERRQGEEARGESRSRRKPRKS